MRRPFLLTAVEAIHRRFDAISRRVFYGFGRFDDRLADRDDLVTLEFAEDMVDRCSLCGAPAAVVGLADSLRLKVLPLLYRCVFSLWW